MYIDCFLRSFPQYNLDATKLVQNVIRAIIHGIDQTGKFNATKWHFFEKSLQIRRFWLKQIEVMLSPDFLFPLAIMIIHIANVFLARVYIFIWLMYSWMLLIPERMHLHAALPIIILMIAILYLQCRYKIILHNDILSIISHKLACCVFSIQDSTTSCVRRWSTGVPLPPAATTCISYSQSTTGGGCLWGGGPATPPPPADY